MNVTTETRREAYINRPTQPRQAAILDALGADELTARQIAHRLGFFDLNAVKPRLTELKAAGILKADRKAIDTVTGRNVAVWRKA